MDGRGKSGTRTDKTIERELGLGRHHGITSVGRRNDVLGRPRPSFQHLRRPARPLASYPYLGGKTKDSQRERAEAVQRKNLKRNERKIQYAEMKRAEGEQG